MCDERVRASGWAALVEVRGVARQLFSNVLLNVANVVYGVCALAALAATPSEAPVGSPALGSPCTRPSAATPDGRHLAPASREPGGGDASWYGCSPEPLAKRARLDSTFYT